MKFLNSIFFFCISLQTSYSQEPVNDVKPDSNGVYVHVEVPASFNGGDINTFREWVQKQLIYPREAVKNKESGRVTVLFIIDETGKLCNTKILRGASPSLDKETLRVINKSPAWSPALVHGMKVKEQFVIPVIFMLN